MARQQLQQSASTLPAELTSFVGRERELDEVQRLLGGARMVTVTGVGGVGKTRLAMRAAARALDEFPDGVHVVELSTLPDAHLLAHAIATTLKLRDQSTRPMLEVLAAYLADKRALLILDTSERYVEECARVAQVLLGAAPGLTILATSREPIGVPGERLVAIAPLDVPDEQAGATPGDAVALFADRAAAVGGFTLTLDNQDMVRRLCRRLDGLPLAIELAASRFRVLSVEQILKRMDHRFALLSVGNLADPARHQALRTTIGWSHELCQPAERLLWTRLSMFPGDFDSEAAEAVCADERLAAVDVADVLSRLVDKSIVVVKQDPIGVRFRLLDTVREYGREWLSALGEEDVLQRRHAEHYLQLAERFDADWFGPRQAEWIARVRAELPNVRAALSYCLDTPGRATTAAGIAGTLYFFWTSSGLIREAKHWLERALAADRSSSEYRVRALRSSSAACLAMGEGGSAAEQARECFTLARELGEPLSVARSRAHLGTVLALTGDLEAARPLLEETLEGSSGLPDGDPFRTIAQRELAFVCLYQGDLARAGRLLAQARDACRAHGEQWWLGYVLVASAQVALAAGDTAQATAYSRESLAVRRNSDDPIGIAATLERLAWIAAADGDSLRAARLLGAAAPLWRTVGQVLYGAPQLISAHDQCVTRTRQLLGDAQYDAEFNQYAEINLDQALDYALALAAAGQMTVPGGEEPIAPRG